MYEVTPEVNNFAICLQEYFEKWPYEWGIINAVHNYMFQKLLYMV